EVMGEIDKAEALGLIEMKSFDSSYREGKEYHLFTCRDDDVEAIEEDIPIEVLFYLKADIKRFGDDTPLLLDFSKCKPFIPTKPIQTKKLSKDKIETIRSHIKKLVPKFERGHFKKEKD